MIDKKKLFIFIQRILETGSETKSRQALEQLEKVLKEQGAPKNFLYIVSTVRDSCGYAKEIAKNEMFDEDKVKIAEERERQRRINEELARRQGRC